MSAALQAIPQTIEVHRYPEEPLGKGLAQFSMRQVLPDRFSYPRGSLTSYAMDLRRIRHFTVLAEMLNFSRAAERLHIAQPALSVSIQKLEKELHTKLFERTSTGVVLTASGASALLEAKRLLFHGEQMKQGALDAAAGTGGRLRIGFVGSAVYRLIPSLIPRFRAMFPNVELVLRESTSGRIIKMLDEDEFDIGLVRTPLLQPSGATFLTLQNDHFLAALPRDHRLARQGNLRLSELANEPFIMYEALYATGLHGSAMTVCQAAGFVPVIAQEAIQIPTVLALVGSGLGVALVPEVMLGHRNDLVAYRELDGLAAYTQTSLALAYHSGVENPTAARFIDMARSLPVL